MSKRKFSGNNVDLTQVDTSGGNIITPLVKPVLFDLKARKVFCTLFNTTDTVDTQIWGWLELNCTKYCLGHHVCPSTGNPHIHIYMEFKNARDTKSIHRAWGLELKPSWEKVASTRAKNWAYIALEQPERTRSNFTATDKPIEPYRFIIEHPYGWQQDIIDKCKEEPDDRTIHWIWDEIGCSGKTSLIKHIATDPDMKGGAILLASKAADAMNEVVKHVEKCASFPRICFMNIPRDKKDFISYGGIETIKDMCFASGKYEGGQIVGPCPHIFVFANFAPDLSKWSSDRFKITHLNPPKESTSTTNWQFDQEIVSAMTSRSRPVGSTLPAPLLQTAKGERPFCPVERGEVVRGPEPPFKLTKDCKVVPR